MNVYTIISILSLILMCTTIVTFCISFFAKDRTGRIKYLRDYKKGKVFAIFALSIPLYWMGGCFDGQTVLNAFFDSLGKAVKLIVFEFNTESVAALIGTNTVFASAMYLCCVMVILNALLFVLSVAGQGIWYIIAWWHFKTSNRERVVLFGNNSYNRSIYKSDSKRVKLIADSISREDAASLYNDNTAYTTYKNPSAFVDKIVDIADRRNEKTIVIINTCNEHRNIELCKLFIEKLRNSTEKERESLFTTLRIFVFGDSRYEAIYENLVIAAYGCMTYVNRHQIIAIDFINKYPYTSFMTEEQIDYDTSTVREGININSIFIGFGRTDRQIFTTSVANNQFIAQENGKTVLKKVQYYIFDKDYAQNNKNLNHNYYRFKNECDFNHPEKYLPLPSYPADEHYYILDINDTTFYNEIRKIISRSERDANFITISFADDLENIDLAHKIVAKCKEWEVENVVIFVKVRKNYSQNTILQSDNCYFIGNENETVYDMESIINDKFANMAQMRNTVYDLEYTLTENPDTVLTRQMIEECAIRSWNDWFKKKSQLERESSIYCCLSLRSKLNMMGLDYCPIDANDERGLTEKEYLEIYAKDDMPDTDYYAKEVDGKPVVHYTLDFKPSRRTALAVQEHYRWNSFMISKGFVPATKEMILNERREINGKERFTNGKNYPLRRHGNITTFEGLEEFRKIVAEREGEKEENHDVIKYDYQLLDDAYWLLAKNGFKIIKKR